MKKKLPAAAPQHWMLNKVIDWLINLDWLQDAPLQKANRARVLAMADFIVNLAVCSDWLIAGCSSAEGEQSQGVGDGRLYSAGTWANVQSEKEEPLKAFLITWKKTTRKRLANFFYYLVMMAVTKKCIFLCLSVALLIHFATCFRSGKWFARNNEQQPVCADLCAAPGGWARTRGTDRDPGAECGQSLRRHLRNVTQGAN